MKILVCGCGRIGSPLLTYIAYANKEKDDVYVTGVDVDESLYGEVKPRFKEELWEEYLSILKDLDKTPHIISYKDIYYPQDVVIITCGTPIDNNGNPDGTQVLSAINSLVKSGAITDYSLVIMRSTLAPGYTSYIRNYLETKYKMSPMIIMAPERISEGNTFDEISRLPQIIGFDNHQDGEYAQKFFREYFPTGEICLLDKSSGGTKAAELAKLFCNTYRYVNFSLGNEFALICDENDVSFEKIRNVCNYNYLRCNISPAALNLGGPCLGKDAKTLSSFTQTALITNAAYEIADKTVLHFIKKYKKDIIATNKVGILGLSFKKESDNMMNSLTIKLIKSLDLMGAKYCVHDPYIKNHPYPSDSLENILKDCSIIFVMTEHKDYKNLQTNLFQTLVRL